MLQLQAYKTSTRPRTGSPDLHLTDDQLFFVSYAQVTSLTYYIIYSPGY